MLNVLFLQMTYFIENLKMKKRKCIGKKMKRKHERTGNVKMKEQEM